jgi:phosphoribosylanthranilate isomerase
MTRVKICGITNLTDATAAVDAGADALGLVFAKSPRRCDPEMARAIAQELSPRALFVGVFRDAPMDEVRRMADRVGLDAVQLHGDESPEYCAELGLCAIKRFAVGDGFREQMQTYRVFAALLDPGAGSGEIFRWEQASGLPRRIIIAGGLTPENVAEPVRLLRPFAVDVASGVETAPGRKDHEKVRAFIQAVRDADAGSPA